MSDQVLIDEEEARLLDLLHQIKEANKMIDLHRGQSGDSFMLSQYKDIKSRFLEELQEILSGYEIKVSIQAQERAA